MEETDEDKITFKVITIGNMGVGKTSIMHKYLYGEFREKILSTIGIDSTLKEVTLKNGTKINLRLYDTAGQERFRSLSQSYFRYVDCVLFVYAANDSESFENIKDWIDIFMENKSSTKDILLYLIENKNDLKKEIKEESINNLKDQYNFEFKSISCKCSENSLINELFQEISEKLFKNGNFDANKKIKRNKRKKKCC